jgi:hypothetical protein
MTVGREAVINVALSLRTSAVPSEVLPSATSPTAEEVLVACRVTGTLVIDSDAFFLAPATPLAQSVKVLSSQDARWRWIVTPKKAGDYHVFVELEPVVTYEGESDPRPFQETLPSRSFDASISVHARADEAITNTTGRTGTHRISSRRRGLVSRSAPLSHRVLASVAPFPGVRRGAGGFRCGRGELKEADPDVAFRTIIGDGEVVPSRRICHRASQQATSRRPPSSG